MWPWWYVHSLRRAVSTCASWRTVKRAGCREPLGDYRVGARCVLVARISARISTSGGRTAISLFSLLGSWRGAAGVVSAAAIRFQVSCT